MTALKRIQSGLRELYKLSRVPLALILAWIVIVALLVLHPILIVPIGIIAILALAYIIGTEE